MSPSDVKVAFLSSTPDERAARQRAPRCAWRSRNRAILSGSPDAQAFTNEYVTKALETLKGEGVDVVGAGFTPETVTLNAGGA